MDNGIEYIGTGTHTASRDPDVVGRGGLDAGRREHAGPDTGTAVVTARMPATFIGTTRSWTHGCR